MKPADMTARGMLAVWVVGLATVAGACSGETAPAPGEAEAGAPSRTTTVPVPPPAPTTSGSAGLDASRPPTDASDTSDAAPDAPTDAAPDAPTDAAPDASDAAPDAADAAPDAGGSTLVQGADGVLRGNIVVGGERIWDGSATLGSASCPVGAMTMRGCCRYFGNFMRGAAVPLELDLATGATTIAGIGMSLGAPAPQADGTLRFQRATITVATPMWRVGVEIARAAGESAQEIDEMSKLLDVARPISDSLRNMVVTWHPTTKVFSLRLDSTGFQGNASACASGVSTFGRVTLSGR
ncbi:MAG TPA: hypothetical protein PK141_02040 [Polyangiaceae bacterium]|nr:hypothetical protein [Polyangiaceae bacterium]